MQITTILAFITAMGGLEAVKWMVSEDMSGRAGQLAAWAPVLRLLVLEGAAFCLAAAVRRDYE
mgnify:CR=1 FL=1